MLDWKLQNYINENHDAADTTTTMMYVTHLRSTTLIANSFELEL